MIKLEGKLVQITQDESCLLRSLSENGELSFHHLWQTSKKNVVMDKRSTESTPTLTLVIAVQHQCVLMMMSGCLFALPQLLRQVITLGSRNA